METEFGGDCLDRVRRDGSPAAGTKTPAFRQLPAVAAKRHSCTKDTRSRVKVLVVYDQALLPCW